MNKRNLMTLALAIVVISSLFAIPQTKCPVTGNDIDKTVFMDVGPKRIYFSNEACIETFVTNMNDMLPEFEKNGIELDDVPGFAQANIKKETTKPAGPLSKCPNAGKAGHSCQSTKPNGGVLLKTTQTVSETTTPEAKGHSCSAKADGKGCTHTDGKKCDKSCTHSADGKTCTRADGTKCDKKCDHSKEGCCKDAKGKGKDAKAGCCKDSKEAAKDAKSGCSGSKTTSAGKCSH